MGIRRLKANQSAKQIFKARILVAEHKDTNRSSMSGQSGTECVLCGNTGVKTRFVKKVGYRAWVCRRHETKD